MNFCQDLKSIPSDELSTFDDPYDMLVFWHSHFLSVLNKHAPLISKQVHVNRLPGWFNSSIRKARSTRDKFLKEDMRSNSAEAWSQFRKWRKNSYYKNPLIDNINNPRQLWKIFKNLVPSKNISSPSALVIDDIKIIDRKEIANQFNSYLLRYQLIVSQPDQQTLIMRTLR